MSNTYRRKYLKPNVEHTRWELTYSAVFSKIMGKGKMSMETTLAVAKFLAFFVYIFTPIYGIFVRMKMRMKVAKIKRSQKTE